MDVFNFFLEGVRDSSDGSMSSDEGSVESGASVQRNERNVIYDTSLPALHSYLGNDLEELSGRTVLDDDSCQMLPVMTLPGVVLIPGQTLPLQLYNPSMISMMRHIIQNDHTFGLINSRYSGRGYTNVLDTVGTTAEIRSYREEDDEYGTPVLRVKAEGRQRFEIIETRTQSDGIILGKVRILPELDVGDPGICSKLNSLNKFQIPPPNLTPDTTKSTNYQFNEPVQCKSHKYNKYDFANYTSVPEFVYKMYDPVILMNRIKRTLQKWNRTMVKESMPHHPKEFSYWIAANLPLDDKQRLDLLRINEVSQRLRLELNILEENCVLDCRDCLSVIAHQEDIFSMSRQGPQGTYVNPNGYVHECITVSKVKGINLLGRASTQQSWFPGYAWTIAECSNCHSHIGWKFTAVDKHLKPTKFWCLARSSIQNRLAPTGPSVIEAMDAVYQ